MSNNDLPAGWSMPDDLANQVSEALNNKPISPEDELADVSLVTTLKLEDLRLV